MTSSSDAAVAEAPAAGIEVVENFHADVRSHYIKRLLALGYAAPAESTDAWTTYLHYLNARRRRIEARPRQVVWSRDLQRRVLLGRHIKAIKRLTRESHSGRDLMPYLSTSIAQVDSYDMLLNDWGLHHFHLGLIVRPDSLYNRTGDLLFVKVFRSQLLLVDILPHKFRSFASTHLVDVMHKNWPALIQQYRYDATSLHNDPSDHWRRKLRDAGVTLPVQVSDGAIYGPMGGGYVTAGANANDVQLANLLFNNLRIFADHYRSHAPELRDAILASCGVNLTSIHLELTITEEGFLVRETQTNGQLPLIPFDGLAVAV